MDDEGDDDPFTSLIIPNCQITSSQEEVLQRSNFATEFGPTLDDDNPRSNSTTCVSSSDQEDSPATEIVIVSLSDDSQEDTQNNPRGEENEEDENFHTPPEHSNSYNSSNNELPPPPPHPPTPSSDERGVDSGNGLDNLGFSESKGTLEIDGGVHLPCVDSWCSGESGTFGGSEDEFGVSRVWVEKLGEGGLNDGVAVEVEKTEIGTLVMEIVESGIKEVCVGLTDDGVMEDALKVSDRVTMRGVEESVCAGEHENVSVEKPVRESDRSDRFGKNETGNENIVMEDVEAAVEDVCVGLMDGMMEDALNVSDRMTVRDVEMNVCASEHQNVSFEMAMRELRESDHIGKSRTENENVVMENVEATIEEVSVGLMDGLMQDALNVRELEESDLFGKKGTENEHVVMEDVGATVEEVCAGLTDGVMEDALNVSDRMTVTGVEDSVCAGEHESVSVGKPLRELDESGRIGKSRLENEKLVMEDVEATIEEISLGLKDGLKENMMNAYDRMTVRDVGVSSVCFSQQESVSVVKREQEESDRIGKSDIMVDNVNVGSASKIPEDKGTEGRRQLPFSLRPQEKNVGEESTSVQKWALKDLLDGLNFVMGEVDGDTEDVDILEIAKRCGLSFPRPRWRQP